MSKLAKKIAGGDFSNSLCSRLHKNLSVILEQAHCGKDIVL